MDIHEARNMLEYRGLKGLQKTTWADLGCGSGTFTLALAGLLSPGSTIHAVDRKVSELNRIPDEHNHVGIYRHPVDFVKDDLKFRNLDGVLMANALHYVKDKNTFLRKIAGLLKAGGLILIVEYDTSRSNPWVPYPVPFEELKTLFSGQGFFRIQKLQKRESLYNPAPLYSAVVERQIDDL